MTHDLICRAYAIGCAVENLRDALTNPATLEVLEQATTPNPVTVGDEYLADDMVVCRCGREPETLDHHDATHALVGLLALHFREGSDHALALTRRVAV